MNAFGVAINVGLLAVGILGFLAAIGVPIWISRHQYGLRWAYLPPKSMLDVAEEIASDLSISFKGSEINNLTQYQFILHNVGYAALKDNAIVTPLEWASPGRILSYRVVGVDPPVNLEAEIIEGHLRLTWTLFNQRCKALIEVLCEGGPSELQDRISGEIENVPQIKEKPLYSQNQQTENAWPKIALVPIFLPLFVGYISILRLLGLHDSVIDSGPLLGVIILGLPMLVMTITVILLISYFANPYAGFIRKVMANDRKARNTSPPREHTDKAGQPQALSRK